jgi:ABC-type uncharacterized transport system substrate-binding protein
MDVPDNVVTKDQLDIVIGRLENKIDARFNAIEARFNTQKILLIVAIVTPLAQIVNSHIPK